MPTDKKPMTCRAERVIELANDEAARLGHNYVGTEHILLGLIKEGNGVAAYALKDMGVTLEDARAKVLSLLGAMPDN